MAAAFGQIAAEIAGKVGGQVLAADEQRELSTLGLHQTEELDQFLGTHQMQWRAQDLKAAGFNPILAAPGSMGMGTGIISGGSAPGNPNMNLGATAMQASLLDAQRRNIEADTAKKQGDTLNPGLSSALAEAETAGRLASAGQADAGADQLRKSLEEIDAKVANYKSQTAGNLISNQTAQMLQSLLVQMKAIDVTMGKLAIPKADAEGQIWSQVSEALRAITTALREPKPDSWNEKAGGWLSQKISDALDGFSGYINDAISKRNAAYGRK